ncbi:MAG TPA: type II secretion system F family protein [Hyphomicrobiaceae bacterium]|nr:type II secretion system F family protein [Hyphomicrobiaceae bacterium]
MLSADMLPLVVALSAAAAFAAIAYVVTYPFVSGDRQVEKRLASVTESRAKKVATRSAAEITANRKKQVADTLKDLDIRQKTKEKVTLRLKLQRAGLDAEPRSFWIASAITGLTCSGVVYVSLPPSAILPLATFTALFIGTLGLPRWILSKMIRRRQSKFLAELANAIDVVVRGVKSGLPLNECLQIIARESPEPVAGEFKEVVEQQRIGVPLAEALERLVLRMPLPEVKFLTIVIAIQQQAGGNLSEALSNLSGVLRDRFRMAMKVKALSAEAKTSAMVLASLPPGVMFMVYGTAPEYIMPLFSSKVGNMFLLFGLCWMGIGVFVMKKMISFKY